MRKTFFILSSVFLFACSSNQNSATIHNVIEQFCEASSTKDEKKMTDLVYPGLFTESLDKGSVQYMFFKQLGATERFKVSNIVFENEPVLIHTHEKEQFYVQSYTSDTDLKISSNASVGFETLMNQIMSKDPNAIIDKEEMSMKFNEKRKIILVQNDQGTFVLPEVFIDFLQVEGLNTEEIKTKFKETV